MTTIGLKHYRLSLSWSRMMNWDASARSMVPNEPGIGFYRSLLEALRDAGITAHVTLYHWDLPQVGAAPRATHTAPFTSPFTPPPPPPPSTAPLHRPPPLRQTLHDELGGWHTPDNEPMLAQFETYARLAYDRFAPLALPRVEWCAQSSRRTSR